MKIDTEKYPQLASRYDVSALPTMMLFRNGTPVHKLVTTLVKYPPMQSFEFVFTKKTFVNIIEKKHTMEGL